MSVMTQTNPGRTLLVAVAAMMIAALAFFGPPGNANTTITEDVGLILLSTGPNASDNWVRYYEGAYGEPGGPVLDVDDFDAQQPISLSRCQVMTDGSILAISQTGGSRGLGLVSNGFGTSDKNNCATGNGQIGGADTLTLALGSNFLDPSFAIDLAEVDIEGKQNADFDYSLDGGPFELFNLVNPASDNGPDSGTGDNEIAAISAEDGFRSITVSATGNSKALISVEGGGDGTLTGGTLRGTLGVNQSLFRVVTTKTWGGELDCGESNAVPAVDSTSSGSDGPAESGLLIRGDDDDTKSNEACRLLVPYTFQIEDDNVFFDFEENQDGNRFLVRIDWDPGDYSPLAPPVRNVDYYNDGDDDYVPGVACITPTDAPLGAGPSINYDYTHPTSTTDARIPDGTNPDGSPRYFADGTEVPVCLAGEQMVLTSAGWQQIQWWDVKGDPRWN